MSDTAYVTKLDALKTAYRNGDRIGALRIAAKFPRLGDHKEAITKGWAAHTNPDFYRQIGLDPDLLITHGIAAMAERYEL